MSERQPHGGSYAPAAGVRIEIVAPLIDPTAFAREIDWTLRTDTMILGRGLTVRKLRWYERIVCWLRGRVA